MDQHKHTEHADIHTITSPEHRLTLSVGIGDGGVWYQLQHGETTIVSHSSVSLYDDAGTNLLSVKGHIDWQQSSHDETWEQPWGEQQYVRDNHMELSLHTDTFSIRFRLFDDGLGFRYELHGEGEVTIGGEETEFNVDQSASGWWIPALGQNHYEHLYKKTTLPEIGVAHTPLTIELPTGQYIAIHEAALYNYGAMNIVPTPAGLKSAITPLATGVVGTVSLPFHSPWRTIVVSDTAYALSASRIMLNLNEPSRIEDTSWIHPAKFMGIWWAMFIGYYTWESGPIHGATTANAFRYINACKEFGIRGLLIEGWNEGWDGDWTKNGEKMNHMQPYPDFDIAAITGYAQSQGVELIGHHETSGNAAHYEFELPEAYDYYRHFGVNYIKTGYVSPRMNGVEFHSSQFGVQHYQKTVELAAERNIMLDIHEPVKGTGIERTWPNLMAREGVMGQEYEGGAISPEHATVLPFTRLLAGPLDYTPGLFNLKGTNRKVQTTLSKQLAFYLTNYSPLQMVADLPEHYEGHPALQFIKDVAVDWELSIPLDGVIGDYFMIARKERVGDDWYVGAVTDENGRDITLTLDFLSEYITYQATIYRDAPDAHWKENPEAYVIETKKVSRGQSIDLKMAPGGGFAIRISPDDHMNAPYPSH